MEGAVRTIPSRNPATYCRLCFAEKHLTPLFSGEDETNLLVEQISLFVGIHLEPEMDGLSSICWRCAVTLDDFILLRQRSLEFDQIIRRSREGRAFEMVNLRDERNEPELLVDSHLSTNVTSSTLNEISGDDTTDPAIDQDSDTIEKCNEGAAIDETRTCELCSIEFRTRSSYFLHCREQHSNGERQFKCTFCTADFKRREHLERHLESHTGIRRYQCNSCDVSYARAKALENHMRRKHANVAYSTKKPALQRGLIKCPFCTETFSCEKSLNAHLKSHNDMLPHICEFCDARFAYALGLSVHKARYHPDPVQLSSRSLKLPMFGLVKCDYCPRNFRIRKHLKEHLEAVHKVMLQDEDENRPIVEKNAEVLPQNVELLPLEIKEEIEESHLQDDHNMIE